MKILILICFLLINFYNLFSQTQYPGLYNGDFEVIINELELIVENNDQGAIDTLHSLILEQTPYIQLCYLKTLSLLNDQDILSYCNDFIYRADNFQQHEYMEDPLEMKVEATKLLIENNDFTTINYIFQFFDLYKPDFNSLQKDILSLFPVIALNIPSTSSAIKEDLIFVFTNSDIDINRFEALVFLDSIFGYTIIDQLVDAVDDSDYSVRSFSLNKLNEYKYVGFNELLKERLLIDPSRSMRTKISQLLLSDFGEPADLKSVIDYHPTETHPTSKSLIGFYIQKFIPPKPDTLDWNELTTTLITYTDELFQYGWIANQQTKDFYSNKLEDIITIINETNEIDSACTIINSQLLPQAEQDLQQELITTEGYKFLHYYTIYIKEEIKEEFGPCP